jgi:hypothetical protein
MPPSPLVCAVQRRKAEHWGDRDQSGSGHDVGHVATGPPAASAVRRSSRSRVRTCNRLPDITSDEPSHPRRPLPHLTVGKGLPVIASALASSARRLHPGRSTTVPKRRSPSECGTCALVRFVVEVGEGSLTDGCRAFHAAITGSTCSHCSSVRSLGLGHVHVTTQANHERLTGSDAPTSHHRAMTRPTERHIPALL